MSLIKLFVFSSILLVYVIPNVACIRLSHKLMAGLWIYKPELAKQLSRLSLRRLLNF